jgi:hypothetical protein
MGDDAEENWSSTKVRDWLFARLRFAVSLDQSDRTNVLLMADEMDRLGLRVDRAGFTFFVRTSTEFCDAIAHKEDPERVATLRRHLRMIDDHRLRKALAAVADLESSATPSSSSQARKRAQRSLWTGVCHK